jgi:hypothetical protein
MHFAPSCIPNNVVDQAGEMLPQNHNFLCYTRVTDKAVLNRSDARKRWKAVH